MTSPQPVVYSAASVKMIYRMLVAGLLGIFGVFGLLFWLGRAPLLPADAGDRLVIGGVLAFAALCSIGMGWFWARPQVPLRPAQTPASSYWDDPATRARALLLWVLWEGSGIISAVGSLLTGTIYPEATAVLALALLLLHSPGALTDRTA